MTYCVIKCITDKLFGGEAWPFGEEAGLFGGKLPPCSPTR